MTRIGVVNVDLLAATKILDNSMYPWQLCCQVLLPTVSRLVKTIAGHRYNCVVSEGGHKHAYFEAGAQKDDVKQISTIRLYVSPKFHNSVNHHADFHKHRSVCLEQHVCFAVYLVDH